MAPSRPDRLRRLKRLALMGALAALAATTLFKGGEVMVAHWRLARYRQVLSDRIAARMEENHALSQQVERMRSDRFTGEAMARERLGMVRPGETVYLLPGGEER